MGIGYIVIYGVGHIRALYHPQLSIGPWLMTLLHQTPLKVPVVSSHIPICSTSGLLSSLGLICWFVHATLNKLCDCVKYSLLVLHIFAKNWSPQLFANIAQSVGKTSVSKTNKWITHWWWPLSQCYRCTVLNISQKLIGLNAQFCHERRLNSTGNFFSLQWLCNTMQYIYTTDKPQSIPSTFITVY